MALLGILFSLFVGSCVAIGRAPLSSSQLKYWHSTRVECDRNPGPPTSCSGDPCAGRKCKKHKNVECVASDCWGKITYYDYKTGKNQERLMGKCQFIWVDKYTNQPKRCGDPKKVLGCGHARDASPNCHGDPCKNSTCAINGSKCEVALCKRPIYKLTELHLPVEACTAVWYKSRTKGILAQCMPGFNG